MTQISLAMPTAVTMLSIENTRLMIAICATTAAKLAMHLGAGLALVALEAAWISWVAL